MSRAPQHTQEHIVQNTATALNQLLERFIAQWELLTGGPGEIGAENFNRVVSLAQENLFDAVALASNEFDFDIRLGSHVLRAQYGDGGEYVYHNSCFGWVEGAHYATGYTTKEEVTSESKHEEALSPHLVNRQVLRYKDVAA